MVFPGNVDAVVARGIITQRGRGQSKDKKERSSDPSKLSTAISRVIGRDSQGGGGGGGG